MLCQLGELGDLGGGRGDLGRQRATTGGGRAQSLLYLSSWERENENTATNVRNGGACLSLCEGFNVARVWQSSNKKLPMDTVAILDGGEAGGSL